MCLLLHVVIYDLFFGVKLSLKQRGPVSFVQVNPKGKDLEHDRDFRIMHYAGNVTYDVNGFMEKNKDQLFQDFKRLLYKRYFARAFRGAMPRFLCAGLTV